MPRPRMFGVLAPVLVAPAALDPCLAVGLVGHKNGHLTLETVLLDDHGAQLPADGEPLAVGGVMPPGPGERLVGG